MNLPYKLTDILLNQKKNLQEAELMFTLVFLCRGYGKEIRKRCG